MRYRRILIRLASRESDLIRIPGSALSHGGHSPKKEKAKKASQEEKGANKIIPLMENPNGN